MPIDLRGGKDKKTRAPVGHAGSKKYNQLN